MTVKRQSYVYNLRDKHQPQTVTNTLNKEGKPKNIGSEELVVSK